MTHRNSDDRSSSGSDSEDSLRNIDIDLYILNEKNKYIDEKFINDIFKKYKIKYKIKNLSTFQRALIHTSYLIIDNKLDKQTRKRFSYIKEKEIEPIDDPKKALPLQTNSYERLEFLGDSVIRTVLSDYLFHRYKNQDEGFMTKLRTKIENGESLAKLTKILGLNEFVVISRLTEAKEGREKNISILEDVFESFIGALFIEAGFELCNKFIIKVVEDSIDIADLLYHDNNYKDMLLRHYHQQKWTDPKYGTLTQSGPDAKREFTMYVKGNDGQILGVGSGPSKKKGEQEAARQALIKLKVLNDGDSDSESEPEYEMSDSDSSSDEYEYIGTESD